MIDLRRLNKRLDYRVEPVPCQRGNFINLFRCSLELPYPETVTVIGEGASKRDSEKRCAAASCLKLMVCECVGVCGWVGVYYMWLHSSFH